MRPLGWLLVIGLILLGPELRSQESAESILPVALAAEVQQSVLAIEQWSRAPQERRTMVTGVIVASPKADQLWLVTFLPTCLPEDTFQIALGRTLKPATLTAFDPRYGLALLQVSGVQRPALEVPHKSLTSGQAGAEVFMVDASAAHGSAAVPGRFAGREPLQPLAASHLRLNLKAPNGSAGSPLFDRERHLIGILTTPTGIAPDSFFALPAERIQRFLADVRMHGKPLDYWLGIVVTESLNTPRIQGCREGSPAQVAGVEPNDVVLSVGSNPVTSLQELIDTTELLPVDKPTELRVLRGQQIKTLKITPSLRLTSNP